ncbi:hypothetical protein MC885_005636, partial [Smutsia gigantea]
LFGKQHRLESRGLGPCGTRSSLGPLGPNAPPYKPRPSKGSTGAAEQELEEDAGTKPGTRPPHQPGRTHDGAAVAGRRLRVLAAYEEPVTLLLELLRARALLGASTAGAQPRAALLLLLALHGAARQGLGSVPRLRARPALRPQPELAARALDPPGPGPARCHRNFRPRGAESSERTGSRWAGPCVRPTRRGTGGTAPDVGGAGKRGRGLLQVVSAPCGWASCRRKPALPWRADWATPAVGCGAPVNGQPSWRATGRCCGRAGAPRVGWNLWTDGRAVGFGREGNPHSGLSMTTLPEVSRRVSRGNGGRVEKHDLSAGPSCPQQPQCSSLHVRRGIWPASPAVHRQARPVYLGRMRAVDPSPYGDGTVDLGCGEAVLACAA